MGSSYSTRSTGVERHSPVSPVDGRMHDGPPLPEAKSDGNYI